jgi:hypothetical protein
MSYQTFSVSNTRKQKGMGVLLPPACLTAALL